MFFPMDALSVERVPATDVMRAYKPLGRETRRRISYGPPHPATRRASKKLRKAPMSFHPPGGYTG
jgi:hypothetical protein